MSGKAAGAAGIAGLSLVTIGITKCDDVARLFGKTVPEAHPPVTPFRPSSSADDVLPSGGWADDVSQSSDDVYRLVPEDLPPVRDPQDGPNQHPGAIIDDLSDGGDNSVEEGVNPVRVPGPSRPDNRLPVSVESSLDYFLQPGAPPYVKRSSVSRVLDDFEDLKSGRVQVDDFSLCITPNGISLTISKGGAAYAVDPLSLHQNIALTSETHSIDLLSRDGGDLNCDVSGEICAGPSGVTGSISACGQTIGYASGHVNLTVTSSITGQARTVQLASGH